MLELLPAKKKLKTFFEYLLKGKSLSSFNYSSLRGMTYSLSGNIREDIKKLPPAVFYIFRIFIY
jgi:hypothetical protein